MSAELISVVIGLVLGGVISAISFHYKFRIEVESKVNVAIFNLLEIWSAISVSRLFQTELFFELFVERIKKRFPFEELGEDAEGEIKKGMKVAFPFLAEAFVGRDEYYVKYKESVKELANIYPLEAFKLNKNHMLGRYLVDLDRLFSNIEIGEGDEALVEAAKRFSTVEAIKQFELDLVDLSRKTGVIKGKKIRKHLSSANSKIDNLPTEIFDECIEQFIAPLIQSHYDSLGIDNPNEII